MKHSFLLFEFYILSDCNFLVLDNNYYNLKEIIVNKK